jgi:predicted nucleic acid-binding protein
VATQAVAEEIARHLPRLATKRGLDQALLFAALQVMPIEWKPATDYEDQRAEAEQRIAARDPDDWPTVALALKLDLPVWSQGGSNLSGTVRRIVAALGGPGSHLDCRRCARHRPARSVL